MFATSKIKSAIKRFQSRRFKLKAQPQVLFQLPEMELTATIDHLIARQIFGGEKDFFFVHIGIFDDLTNNVLRQLIEKRDCGGLFVSSQIAPEVENYQLLKKKYRNLPNIIFENLALDNADGQRIDWSLASCISYEPLIKKNNIRRIDVLQIDSEGMDYELLKSFPFNERRPSIIRYKHSHLSISDRELCWEFLVEKNYQIRLESKFNDESFPTHTLAMEVLSNSCSPAQLEMKLNISDARLREILGYHRYSLGAGKRRKAFGAELYYSININGQFFSGARSFEKRWEYLKKINVTGQKILDIGSNIGLLGIFYLIEGGAQHVTMIEHDDACAKIINLLAEELSLADKITIHNEDFNTIDLQQKLGGDFDIVSLLSSFKYFNDREKALEYFKQFNQIIFEGDDEKFEAEFEQNFASNGFDIQPIARIDERSYGVGRNRMLYKFTKHE